jgi:hypothetical protein
MITIKKSIDIPEDLFTKVMDYAHEQKKYKFTPAVLDLLRKALTDERKEN